jgi:peroxiredoxin
MRRLAMIVGALLGCVLSVSGAGALSGRRAPGFSLPDTKYQYHDLADHRGKIVLLDLMRTTCPTCQKLAQTLEKAKAKYGDRISVLSVVTPPDSPQAVAEFAAKFNVTSPILLDCGQMVGSYMRPDPKRPTVLLPHLFIIDKEGIIRNDFGHDDTEAFEGPILFKEIDRLLSGKNPVPAEKSRPGGR